MKNTLIKVNVLFETYSIILIWWDKFESFMQISQFFKDNWEELEVKESDFEWCFWKTFYEAWVDPVLWVSDELETVIEAVPIVAHESIHCVDLIFEYLSEESHDEIYATCIELFMRKFIHIYS